MKKWLIGILVLIILMVVCSYIFIPTPIVVSNVARLGTSQKALVRWFSTPTSWQNILHAQKQTTINNSSVIVENGYTFLPGIPVGNTVSVNIVENGDSISSHVLLLFLAKDSVALSWECVLTVSNNPFERLMQYWKARKIKSIFTSAINNIKTQITNEINISGIDVRKQIVSDTFLLAKKTIFASYPTPQQVYGLIGELNNYAIKEQAAVSDSPMLHINYIDSTHFGVMVALPINKKLADLGDISFKQMVKGLILNTEVTGGPWMIRNTFNKLSDYVQDHGYTEVALPFESLTTNRLQQSDTSKWVTKIYYPVF